MDRRSALRRPPSFLVAFAFLGLLGGVAARPAQEDDWTVLLSGDADGYLAPCGCTSPMQGGLKRRVAALRGGGHRVLLDNGGLGGGTGRQWEIKAETAAQALALAAVDAANLKGEDAKLVGALANLSRGNLPSGQLPRGRLVSTSLASGENAPVDAWRASGPFLIGGATRRTDLLAREFEGVLRPADAAHRLVEEAQSRGLAPILLFDGDFAAARALAQAEPDLRLVTYRATGRPPSALQREGACALATPGEHGKGIIHMVWRAGGFVSSAVETLGPEVPDDVAATELYRTYLRRVAGEKLLDRIPRTPGKAFSGSEKCASCHAEAAKVWRASEHAHALGTLEHEGSDRDPDCVGCHVVGLGKDTGFWSRKRTPKLADVGCESCHGAGAAHSASPWKVKLPKVGQEACLPCHTLTNSPEFDFSTYWPRIKHGR